MSRGRLMHTILWRMRARGDKPGDKRVCLRACTFNIACREVGDIGDHAGGVAARVGECDARDYGAGDMRARTRKRARDRDVCRTCAHAGVGEAGVGRMLEWGVRALVRLVDLSPECRVLTGHGTPGANSKPSKRTKSRAYARVERGACVGAECELKLT